MSKDDRKDFYRTVSRGLQRPLFSVYRRVIRMYDHRNYVGKYSPEEIVKLKQYVDYDLLGGLILVFYLREILISGLILAFSMT